MLSGQLSLSPVEDVAVHRWMVGSDNGASSRYMVNVLMGRPSAEPYSFPRDLADLEPDRDQEGLAAGPEHLGDRQRRYLLRRLQRPERRRFLERQADP